MGLKLLHYCENTSLTDVILNIVYTLCRHTLLIQLNCLCVCIYSCSIFFLKQIVYDALSCRLKRRLRFLFFVSFTT